MNYTTNFVNNSAFEFLKNEVIQCLVDSQVDVEKQNVILSMFYSFKQPFDGLNTEWQRLKKFKESGNLISPSAVVIGVNTQLRKEEKKTTFYSENATIQYIPIALVLKRFLELPSVLNRIKSYVEFLKSQEKINVVSNFLQGELWKKMTSESSDKFVLPLFIYRDDFETNNSLGNHAGCGGKLTGVYGQIASLPSEFATNLDNMFLIQIFRSLDKKIYGNKAIFRRLIDDLKDLSTNGIEVVTEDGCEKVYFELGCILGDNLGMHEILGFVASFSASHPCRLCEIPKHLLKITKKEVPSLIRTQASYDEAVKHLTKNGKHVNGITEQCVWHDLPNFHVVDNMTVDLMHDFLEGICKIVLVKVLQSLTSDKFIKHETLNNRMATFDFGENCKQNKPPDISPDHIKNSNLKLSSDECLYLMRHLGLLIGDLVPTNNLSWKVYTTLNDILHLLLEKVHHRSTYDLIDTLITEHSDLYEEVFKKKFLNKQHHSTHYSRILKTTEPVSETSAMRGESKNKEMKGYANLSSCKKNLPHTVAHQHQLHQYQYFSSFSSDYGKPTMGPTKPVHVLSMQKYISLFSTLKLNSLIKGNVKSRHWVNYKGNKFVHSNIITVNAVEKPMFFSTHEILFDTVTNEVLFITKKIDSDFNAHFQAFEIHEDDLDFWQVIHLHEIDGTSSLSTQPNGKKYICQKI